MLCQFEVKNFRCIKESAVLSMVAADGLSEHRESLLTQGDEISFLPLATIYGANGGGKSTVLDALYCLCLKVMMPIVAVGSGIQSQLSDSFSHIICPFAFDEESGTIPTEFGVVFRTKEYEYDYHLSLLNDLVVKESLYHKRISGGRYTRVFYRVENTVFQLTKSLRKAFGKNEEQVISASIPLLSFLGILNGRHDVIADVMSWFRGGIEFLDYKNSFRERYMNLPENGMMKEKVLDFLTAMGLDIVDYRLEKIGENSNGEMQFRIFTKHRVKAHEYELELKQESSGTIKIFNSLPFIISSLLNGRLLVADELDAKLHPALLQYLLRLFSDPNLNRHGAQLLITSQDILTMSSENFRRDEIWFAAKNADQESQLYALSDFRDEDGAKVRKDSSYSKQYMEGRYGADPFFKRLIGWEVLE